MLDGQAFTGIRLFSPPEPAGPWTGPLDPWTPTAQLAGMSLAQWLSRTSRRCGRVRGCGGNATASRESCAVRGSIQSGWLRRMLPRSWPASPFLRSLYTVYRATGGQAKQVPFTTPRPSSLLPPPPPPPAVPQPNGIGPACDPSCYAVDCALRTAHWGWRTAAFVTSSLRVFVAPCSSHVVTGAGEASASASAPTFLVLGNVSMRELERRRHFWTLTLREQVLSRGAADFSTLNTGLDACSQAHAQQSLELLPLDSRHPKLPVTEFGIWLIQIHGKSLFPKPQKLWWGCLCLDPQRGRRVTS
ncbi:unnamed protein product [Diplocarpon coronariae]